MPRPRKHVLELTHGLEASIQTHNMGALTAPVVIRVRTFGAELELELTPDEALRLARHLTAHADDHLGRPPATIDDVELPFPNGGTA